MTTKLTQLPRCPGKAVQRFGRAWRPGNKPRLYWNTRLNIWMYDIASVGRIRRVCTDREVLYYEYFAEVLNRLNTKWGK